MVPVTMLRAGFLCMCALVLAGGSAACDGYAEIPVPVREGAELTVESVDLHPDAVGLVQVSVTLPEEYQGTMVVVDPPTTYVAHAGVVSWAVGACPRNELPETAVTIRLCVAVLTFAAPSAEPFDLHLVLEARAHSRRFSVSGEVAP